MNLCKKLLCTMGITLLLSSTTLFAADKTARDILNRAYQTIGSMDKYSFTATVVENEEFDGKKSETYKHVVNVKVDRPNRLRVDVKGTVKNRSNYLNDGQFTMIDHDYGYYAQVKIAKSINKTLDTLFERFGIKAPLAQLIYSDMDRRVRFKTSKYFGKVKVLGEECDYVAFRNAKREIHLWITTGDTPLVKFYSIIDKSSNYTSRINTTLKWNSSKTISDSDFIFVAPKASSKISIIRAK